jgi:dihydrofolate synthase/folylpolyglutamate synthase
LASVTERARVDGIPISEEGFGDLTGEIRDASDRIAYEHGRPTYYESLLALAFLWFARAEVDVAVIEAGVGGTLDGTNVLTPRVAVITNIGLDHTEILGDTLEEIARDKAGIVKPGVPLVTDTRDPAARRVIETACAAAGAPFVAVTDTTTIEQRPGERYGQSFTVITPDDRYEVALPVLGAFQQRNAATAIRALEQLAPPLRPSRDAIEEGFAKTILPGRMEFFPSHPGVVFDIAHNPDKAANLAQALGETFPGRRFIFVMAIGESKDAAEILRPFVELGGSFIFTAFTVPGKSASRPQRLASIADELGAWGRAIADPVEAFVRDHRGDRLDVRGVGAAQLVDGECGQQCLSVRSARAARCACATASCPGACEPTSWGSSTSRRIRFPATAIQTRRLQRRVRSRSSPTAPTASTSAPSRRAPGTRRSMPRPNARA